MTGGKRIVIVGRRQESVDRLMRALETAGYIVSVTIDDGVAIDLVGSSDYAALLIEDAVPQRDRLYIATQARNRQPGLPVLTVNNPRSILTQLSQILPR